MQRIFRPVDGVVNSKLRFVCRSDRAE